MKTNQIMLRDGIMQQRTDNGFFNATNTINRWNEANNEKKLMAQYSKLNGTIEYINYLVNNEKILKPLIISTKGTFMHPLLFIDFCMWISIEFKTLALKYVLDGLIKSRHDAGDYYNQMTAVIMDRYIEYNGCKPSPMIYQKEANMIKEIAGVFCERNEMTEKQLAIITALQKINSQLIINKVGIESRKKQLTLVAKALYL